MDGDGARTVENHHRKRCDQICGELIEGAQGSRLLRPEVAVCIARHVFKGHHLCGAPGVKILRQIQLAGNGTVELAVVCDDDAGFLGEIFPSKHRHFRINESNQGFDEFEEAGIAFAIVQLGDDLSLRGELRGWWIVITLNLYYTIIGRNLQWISCPHDLAIWHILFYNS